MELDASKVATFIATTNELMRRYGEHLQKEAHYKEVVGTLGPRLAQKLYELGAIPEDKKDDFLDTLNKSAAAPLEYLDTLVNHLSDSSSYELGSPLISSNANPAASRVYGGKNPVRYEDFEMDVSKYL